MDYGARQGAGDSLDGLDSGNDKLPESINVCGLHAHYHVVGAGKDVGGANAGDTAKLRGYPCLFRDLGLDQNVGFDFCFSRRLFLCSTVVRQTTSRQGRSPSPQA